MEILSEDSPWHREANVAVHTEMVLNEFFKLNREDKHFDLAAVSLLFHDTGKPATRSERYKPERGTYYVYAGHEQKSARIFEDFYMSNQDIFENWLSKDDMHKVSFIIENHLPFKFEKDAKISAFRDALYSTLGDLEEAFFDHVICDTRGRISDDAEEKIKSTVDWVENIKSIKPINIQSEPKVNQPILTVLIGASGSGKSTYSKNTKNAEAILGSIIPQ